MVSPSCVVCATGRAPDSAEAAERAPSAPRPLPRPPHPPILRIPCLVVLGRPAYWQASQSGSSKLQSFGPGVWPSGAGPPAGAPGCSCFLLTVAFSMLLAPMVRR